MLSNILRLILLLAPKSIAMTSVADFDRQLSVSLSKFDGAVLVILLLCVNYVQSFQLHRIPNRQQTLARALNIVKTADQDEANILLRALRGETVSRTPVWLMRQVRIPLTAIALQPHHLNQTCNFYATLTGWAVYC